MILAGPKRTARSGCPTLSCLSICASSGIVCYFMGNVFRSRRNLFVKAIGWLFLVCGFLLTGFTLPARAQDGPETDGNEIEIWTTGGHGTNGSTQHTGVWTAGFRYGWVITAPHGPGLSSRAGSAAGPRYLRDLPGRYPRRLWGTAAGARDPSAEASGQMGAKGAHTQDSLGCRSYSACGGRGRGVRPSKFAHPVPSLPPAANPCTVAPASVFW